MRKMLLLASLAALAAFPSSASTPLPVQGDSETIDWKNEQQFWSFRPPLRQDRPAVIRTEWPKQPIDFFILAKLEEKNLAPSDEAGRMSLLRRLSFDLTGLPPSTQEIDAFASDNAPDAYRRTVDRLLNSPAFGERMASFWLPLARYAEDQAHQVGSDTKYFYPNAYRYRQWVIDAFNRDLPYDAFVKLQLAADKLDNVPESDLAALGFLGLGPKYYNRGRIEVMADEWEDRVDTVTRTMLGLTVACARCHDHKFEPITMKDYYGMAGIFASTRMVNKPPGGEEEKKDASADKMSPETLHMVEDGDSKDLHVFLRGDPQRKGPVIQRRFLRILSNEEPAPITDGSGRTQLAEAIGSSENPLTARVFVNRVWTEFFGTGLVPTPSNFGRSGDLPAHPELLDDLAARFMENGWSVKALVREIVLSAAYQQRSNYDRSAKAAELAADPANRLLWRMNRKRLSIEQWRDAVLYASGGLKPEGGQSLELDDPNNTRRTVYARVSRLKLNDTFMQFDYPDANVHAEKRTVTTTPMQKLFLLNNPFVLHQAAAFSRSIQSFDASSQLRIAHAYKTLFARSPEDGEITLANEFLNQPGTEIAERWTEYAQMLLVSNEMMYVD